MKIYKLIPSHNVLTSFSTNEARLLINIIERVYGDVVLLNSLTKAQQKRLQTIKRSLIVIAHTKKK